MNARRIRRQHEPQGRRLRLVAHHDAAAFDAVAARKNLKRQPACQCFEHLIHVRKHEEILLHVRLAHVLRQPGCRRLSAGELVGRLHAIADRERVVEIEIAGPFDPLDQFVARYFAKQVASRLGMPHVALQESAIGLADARHRLAADEVSHFILLQRVVRLAPAKYGKGEHRG